MSSSKLLNILFQSSSFNLSKRCASKIHPNILSCIGNTPMVRLDKFAKDAGVECELLAKCEYVNPGGSHKDRSGLLEIERAEASGKIGPDTIIVSPTTGNAGISLAMVCAYKGYRCVLVMPDKMGLEKVNIIDAFGIHLVRAPSVTDESSPESYQNIARRLAAQIKNGFLLDQYATPDNPEAHYLTTGVEILEACDGKLDAVVIGAGSGATASGVGKRLKEHDPNIKVIAVHTQGSTLDQPTPKDSHERVIEGGLGHTFLPEVLDRSVIDDWIQIDNHDMFQTARKLQRREGILCGASSGAVVAAAVQLAKKMRPDQRVVTVLSDGVRNYLYQFMSEDWLKRQGWSMQDFAASVLPDKPIDLWDWPPIVYVNKNAQIDEAVKKFKLFAKSSDYLLILDDGGFVAGVVSKLHLVHRLAKHSVTELTVPKYATLSHDASVRHVGRKLKHNPIVLILNKGVAATSRPHYKQVKSAISSISLVTRVFEEPE